jgi:hypothetical protein
LPSGFLYRSAGSDFAGSPFVQKWATWGLKSPAEFHSPLTVQ